MIYCCVYIYSSYIIIIYTGVGVAVEDQFLGSIPNNTIIISSGSHKNILCHSASKTACSGQWLSPTNEVVTVRSECSPLLHSYVSMTLTGDKQSGIYTCITDDEHDITQSVYIGIYSSLTEVEHEGELIYHDHLSLYTVIIY